MEEEKELTIDEITDSIKKALNDNKESLEHIDSLLNSLIELKKLDEKNPGAKSFRLWIICLLTLFGGIGFNYLDKELIKDTGDESDNKDRESNSMEEGSQCG